MNLKNKIKRNNNMKSIKNRKIMIKKREIDKCNYLYFIYTIFISLKLVFLLIFI